MSAYQQLEAIFHELSQLEGAMSILHWDSATYMPTNSSEVRGEQLSTLSTIHHEKLCNNQVADLLAKATEETGSLNQWQKRNLQLMQREYDHSSLIPTELLQKIVKKGLACETLWSQAKQNNDFATYEPLQQEVLELARQTAQIKSEAFGLSLYDSLLDQYDEGRRSSDIDQIFAQLQSFLPNFIAEVTEQQKSETQPILPKGPFKVRDQKKLGTALMHKLGFPFEHGRIDESAHPFCGGVSGDIRLTTRYDETEFTSALMGVLHETGHAMYEAGLPTHYRYQPVGQSLGMTMHESQSLFVEMQLCRNPAFMEYLAPQLQHTFGHDFAWGPHNLAHLYQQVTPDFIRVDADEVTYPCHVMLRYDIEKQLIESKIEIKDVPELWNTKMQELLGITPPDYAQGCMQDVHWTDGSFGYFPTYSLGAMLAAQWKASMAKELNIEALLEDGDFAPIMQWLRSNLHQHASLYTTDELCKKVTGEALNPVYFIDHLKERYGV